MRRVAVLGIGSTPFGIFKDRQLEDLAADACNRALNDAGIDRKKIEAFYLSNYIYGTLNKQEIIASMVPNILGLKKEVEGTFLSPGIVFRNGWLLVASGLCDYVLVAGVEKMSNLTTEKIHSYISLGLEWEQERTTGLTFPGYYGMITRRYMHEFGVSLDTIHKVAVKNRKNGVKNPRAHFRREVSLDDIKNSRVIADPLKLYDCSHNADGAAAVVLGPADMAHKFNHCVIEIMGCSQASGFSNLYAIEDLTTMLPTVYAARKAFAMAGIRPADVDVLEIYDCFSISEIIISEDLGFFKKGEGAKALEDGLTKIGGPLPINPSGGLLSKGHPVGTSGLGEVHEIVIQLRGEHENQVEGARTGLTHYHGATSQISAVSILKRKDDLVCK